MITLIVLPVVLLLFVWCVVQFVERWTDIVAGDPS